mgnify:CR=1 FL=1
MWVLRAGDELASVFGEWGQARTRTVSAECAHAMMQSAEFYSLNSYAWDCMPYPVDGEVGFFRPMGRRIVVKLNRHP